MSNPEPIGRILPRVMDDLDDRRVGFRQWLASENMNRSQSRPPFLRGGLEPARPSPVLPPPGPLFNIPDYDDAPPPSDYEAGMYHEQNEPFE